MSPDLMRRLGEAADAAANGRAICDCPTCLWVERVKMRKKALSSTAWARGLNRD